MTVLSLGFSTENGLKQSVIVGSSNDHLTKLTEFLKPVAQSRHHWERCWQASRDGWEAKRFHDLCDGKGPTVTIVKVNKYIFGAYTSRSWGGKSFHFVYFHYTCLHQTIWSWNNFNNVTRFLLLNVWTECLGFQTQINSQKDEQSVLFPGVTVEPGQTYPHRATIWS